MSNVRRFSMKLDQFVEFEELIGIVRRREDRRTSYCVYWKDEAEEPTLQDNVLVAAPSTVENDVEVFPRVVLENGYWTFCSDQLVQDVVDVAIKQYPDASSAELREALLHYLERDSFLEIKRGK
jgi:hypothetical protein